MRTFVAFEISNSLKERLADLQARLRKFVPNLKFTLPHQLHLTLKFLGEIEEAELPDLKSALESIAARHKPFDLHPKHLGTFGRPTNITVLWLGLTDPSNGLHQLHADLEFALSRLGHPPEERPFKPHLTLARNKNPNLSRNIRRALDAEPQFKSAAEHVTKLTLYQSVLKADAAVHTALSSHRLMP